jgi:hypothetical protein
MNSFRNSPEVLASYQIRRCARQGKSTESSQFRRLDKLHRHLFDKDDFLGGHVFLLQQPFEVPNARNRLCVLQRIDNQMDMLVNDRLIGPRRKPGNLTTGESPGDLIGYIHRSTR